MKTRHSFVSNSSSSSFVISNWSALDDGKKDMVLNYAEHVRDEWRRNGLPISGSHGFDHIDLDAAKDLPGDLARSLDFGWLDDGWSFREKDGRLEMVTMVDNFDMGKWLAHVGGISFEWTGESFGFFKGEEPELCFPPEILFRRRYS